MLDNLKSILKASLLLWPNRAILSHQITTSHKVSFERPSLETKDNTAEWKNSHCSHFSDVFLLHRHQWHGDKCTIHSYFSKGEMLDLSDFKWLEFYLSSSAVDQMTRLQFKGVWKKWKCLFSIIGMNYRHFESNNRGSKRHICTALCLRAFLWIGKHNDPCFQFFTSTCGLGCIYV